MVPDFIAQLSSAPRGQFTCLTGLSNRLPILLSADSGVTAELEITHPGGCRIRIRQACDPQLLASVLAVLDFSVTHAAGGV